MDRVQFFKPELADLVHIAANLRLADANELRATHGDDVDIRHRLIQSVKASEEAFTAFTAYGEPMAVFGVAPISLLGGEGCPWMLGTNTMLRYGRELVTLGRAHADRWNCKYPLLYNYVDARNLRSIAWLRRTGFNILKAEPRGAQGLPFHRLERCT